MAQVFDRGLVLALKLSALVAVALIVAGVYLWRWAIDYPHQIGAPPTQPLPFSHLHHVGQDGIDCRYCHTSVETSPFAGIPSSDVCMTCHSQLFREVPLFAVLHQSVSDGTRLQWTQVNDLPDFVYFNHSAHIAHGVPCTACHGRVDEMPLTERAASLHMRWCLGCHRQPQAHLVVPAEVFSTLARGSPDPARQHQLLTRYGLNMRRWLTDCSTCHR
ncbi:MAG TPA: cytochrome c3 family protein [Steroidobacteraceae bacterium]|jgi:hypothetical protein|nr:cytochrome c3 family protein [Steroidobacteraceae bacterium]